MNSVILAILAATTVYRLELTDEKPYIVGQDGVKREVVIMDPDEHAALTGKVDQVWKSMNSTEDGRRKLHGLAKETVIDETEKVTVYADGYCHRAKMEKRTNKVMESVRVSGEKKKTPVRRVYSNMSERHKAFMEKRDAALDARAGKNVKTVTVEHDAATGKDIVK